MHKVTCAHEHILAKRSLEVKHETDAVVVHLVAEIEDHLAKTLVPAEDVGNVLQSEPPTQTPKQVLSSDQ